VWRYKLSLRLISPHIYYDLRDGKVWSIRRKSISIFFVHPNVIWDSAFYIIVIYRYLIQSINKYLNEEKFAVAF